MGRTGGWNGTPRACSTRGMMRQAISLRPGTSGEHRTSIQGLALIRSAGSGLDNIYVAKYDADHIPLWVAHMGGGAWLDHGSAVATGPSGECVAVGQFFGSGDFDPGPGVHTLTAIEESDVFVVKLDATGSLQWAVQLGDSLYDNALDVAVDALGNILVAGWFEDTVDVDPGPGVVYFNVNSWNGGFLIKLDPTGLSGGLLQLGYEVDRMIITPSGDIVAIGEIGGSMDADPGPGSLILNEDDGGVYMVQLVSYGDRSGRGSSALRSMAGVWSQLIWQWMPAAIRWSWDTSSARWTWTPVLERSPELRPVRTTTLIFYVKTGSLRRPGMGRDVRFGWYRSSNGHHAFRGRSRAHLGAVFGCGGHGPRTGELDEYFL